MAIPKLSIWHELLRPDHADLVAAAAATDARDVAAVERLRRMRSQEMVRAALLLAEARRKAADKWPAEIASALVADPQGVEMASSHLVAGHKAARMARTLGAGARVVDLCCGIGGDAMALCGAGLSVVGIDKDEARAFMCARNAGCATRACDVLDAAVPDGAFHLDPSRRTEDEHGAVRRTFQIDDHWPGPAVWRRVIDARAHGAIKLGPGLDVEAVRRILPAGIEHQTEIISERGRLTQAVVWIGQTAGGARGSRMATLLRPGEPPRSLTAEAGGFGEPPAAESGVGRYLIEPDASIERAGLLLAACHGTAMRALAPGLGLLSSPVPAAETGSMGAAMMTTFAVIESMPWIEKNVRARLREHGAGIVEVKTRGRAVDPDQVQMRLRGEGEERLTVFVLRLGRSIEAVITRRI